MSTPTGKCGWVAAKALRVKLINMRWDPPRSTSLSLSLSSIVECNLIKEHCVSSVTKTNLPWSKRAPFLWTSTWWQPNLQKIVHGLCDWIYALTILAAALQFSQIAIDMLYPGFPLLQAVDLYLTIAVAHFSSFNSPKLKFIGCQMLQNISRSTRIYAIFLYIVVSIHNHCVWWPAGVPSMRMYFGVFKSFASFTTCIMIYLPFSDAFSEKLVGDILRLLDLLTDDITKKPAIVVLRSLAEENEAFSCWNGKCCYL